VTQIQGEKPDFSSISSIIYSIGINKTPTSLKVGFRRQRRNGDYCNQKFAVMKKILSEFFNLCTQEGTAVCSHS